MGILCVVRSVLSADWPSIFLAPLPREHGEGDRHGGASAVSCRSCCRRSWGSLPTNRILRAGICIPVFSVSPSRGILEKCCAAPEHSHRSRLRVPVHAAPFVILHQNGRATGQEHAMRKPGARSCRLDLSPRQSYSVVAARSPGATIHYYTTTSDSGPPRLRQQTRARKREGGAGPLERAGSDGYRRQVRAHSTFCGHYGNALPTRSEGADESSRVKLPDGVLESAADSPKCPSNQAAHANR